MRLLQEIYALYQVSSSHSGGYYGYGYGYSDVKWLDVNKFESRQLWPLLDEADALGIRLVHARKQFGDVARYGSAELCMDVTTPKPSGALVVTPAIRINGVDVNVVPVGFIGSNGHGLVYVDRVEVDSSGDPRDWRPKIARFGTSVPLPLQRIALKGPQLEIPAADLHRFRDEYYLQLRRVATIVSSDNSFVPPSISGPVLVLGLQYGPAHRLTLDGEWAYQVGEKHLRLPLDSTPQDPGHRDLDAEQEVLAKIGGLLAEFGLYDTHPSQGAISRGVLLPHAELDGLNTVRFTTEVLPLLKNMTEVKIEATGEPTAYREVGDSLTVGISTVERTGETDWFDLKIDITVEGHPVAFADVFVALAQGQSHMLLANGAYFSLDKPELQRLATLIEEARALTDSQDGSLRISRFQAGLWGELAALGVVQHQADAWRQQVNGLLEVNSIQQTPVPKLFGGQLRPYQQDGFEWLAFLWKFRLGGILADDMGLGKTLQALALICHAEHTEPTNVRFLVITPTSVVPNWVAEAARFTPHLQVAAITDTLRRRGQSLAELTENANIVVTSYTLFRIDFEAYSEIPWSGLLLDEAQFAKNHQSKVYHCVRRLPTPFKLAITGTPMENNLMELWSLLSITAPGLFPSPARFRDYYVRPIEKQGNAELLNQLRRRIKPLVTRRTKEQVAADLPSKQEQVLTVELHPRHRKIYETHMQRERQKILGLLDDINSHRFTILSSLTLLRQLSLHAGLVDEEHADLPSAKIDILLEQLFDVVDSGHRALVFSQFTRFLNKVRTRLDAEGIAYCHLDGKTQNRTTVLNRFKKGTASVFLISLKAGGFGLNLTEADYCFILDPWWNPATESQAIDRTHRIGQTRNVMVYRLIAHDTIEEKVMALKARKAELFASIMDDGNGFNAELTADDIRSILS
jgi:superfamily II DNA or RNA helicase